ncbi:MAG: NAD-dependent epimerase/dehydratase family protein [Candidatus Dadabacteria bacterium]|nr:MAG: NAD-dependent epimerase/dehydratase family protein [Candidatus Dadabacteria bacterium]
MEKILVTGATGFVGTRLCKELVEHGYSVRGMHRASSNIEPIKDMGVELVEGDVTEKESLLAAMDGVDTVYHIAALFREAKHPDEVYWKVNRDGVVNVLEAAYTVGVDRVVHCSTVGVHSHIPNPPADESEAYRPGDIYQLTKCEGEKEARRWFESGKLKGVIIRPAMIWGPGDKRTLKLFRGIARRRLPIIGTGKTLLHWVLVDDLAAAFRLAGEREEAVGNIYIIAGERPVELEYLFFQIAKELGVQTFPFRIPAKPIQLLGSMVEAVCVPFGIEPPIYRRRVDFFTKTRAFDYSRAKRDLGYLPSHTFEEEVGIIAKWYRDHGWL